MNMLRTKKPENQSSVYRRLAEKVSFLHSLHVLDHFDILALANLGQTHRKRFKALYF